MVDPHTPNADAAKPAFDWQSCIKYSTNKYQYQYQYQSFKYQNKYQYLTFKYQDQYKLCTTTSTVHK